MRRALVATGALALVCCGIYPLAVFGIAQVAFPEQANGSLITDRQGNVRGSKLLGQAFAAAKYFHPRPSAAGSGYDGANSGGSNLGPTSRKLADALRERIRQYRQENGLKESELVPADAVTASGSGLDPHISRRNAEIQLARVAKARDMPEEKLRALIERHTAEPNLGCLGEAGINVLCLNLALDEVTGPEE